VDSRRKHAGCRALSHLTLIFLATHSIAAAQNRKRTTLDVRWGLTTVEVSANSKSGIQILAHNPSDLAFVAGLCPSTVNEWADQADSLLRWRAMTPAAGEEIEGTTEELWSYGRLSLKRTLSRQAPKDVLVFSYGSIAIVPVSVRDSVVRVFLAALRSAAKAQTEMAGDPCLSNRTTAIPSQHDTSSVATPIDPFIPPLPIPESIWGRRLEATFEVDEKGNAKLIDVTQLPDAAYNKRLGEALRSLHFRPGTKGAVPIVSRTKVIYDF
jgi:hypothetical protein